LLSKNFCLYDLENSSLFSQKKKYIYIYIYINNRVCIFKLIKNRIQTIFNNIHQHEHYSFIFNSNGTYRVEPSASAGETSKLTRANSTRANITSTKPKAPTPKPADKRIEVSCIDFSYIYMCMVVLEEIYITPKT
jgi:hypothetical protein